MGTSILFTMKWSTRMKWSLIILCNSVGCEMSHRNILMSQSSTLRNSINTMKRVRNADADIMFSPRWIIAPLLTKIRIQCTADAKNRHVCQMYARCDAMRCDAEPFVRSSRRRRCRRCRHWPGLFRKRRAG